MRQGLVRRSEILIFLFAYPTSVSPVSLITSELSNINLAWFPPHQKKPNGLFISFILLKISQLQCKNRVYNRLSTKTKNISLSVMNYSY